MNSQNLAKIFEGNWDEVKGNIRSHWGKLTDQDLQQIEGSYESFVGKLKKIYGYTKEQAERELDEFLSSKGMEDVEENMQKVKNTANEGMNNLKHLWEDGYQKYLQPLKEKTIQMEANVVCYAKENPLKLIGITAVTTFVISKFFSAR